MRTKLIASGLLLLIVVALMTTGETSSSTTTNKRLCAVRPQGSLQVNSFELKRASPGMVKVICSDGSTAVVEYDSANNPLWKEGSAARGTITSSVASDTAYLTGVRGFVEDNQCFPTEDSRTWQVGGTWHFTGRTTSGKKCEGTT